MLKKGDRILHYIDEIEGYRLFVIDDICENDRYTLKGVDTKTNLSRRLDNKIRDRRFNYIKVEVGWIK